MKIIELLQQQISLKYIGKTISNSGKTCDFIVSRVVVTPQSCGSVFVGFMSEGYFNWISERNAILDDVSLPFSECLKKLKSFSEEKGYWQGEIFCFDADNLLNEELPEIKN